MRWLGAGTNRLLVALELEPQMPRPLIAPGRDHLDEHADGERGECAIRPDDLRIDSDVTVLPGFLAQALLGQEAHAGHARLPRAREDSLARDREVPRADV